MPDKQTDIDLLARYLGQRKVIARKPKIESPPHFPAPYVWRSSALGQSSKSEQGVAGWRTNYHRPNTTPLEPEKRWTIPPTETAPHAKRKSSVVSRKAVAGGKAKSRKRAKNKS